MAEISEHIVSFKILDYDCTSDEITSVLELEPTKIGIKGQKYEIGPKHKRITKTWKQNRWIYEVLVKRNNHWVGNQIDDFIKNVITPRQHKLKNIISTCRAEFKIVQYLYDSFNPGLHFSNSQLKIITDIGADIDVDIYVLKNAVET